MALAQTTDLQRLAGTQTAQKVLMDFTLLVEACTQVAEFPYALHRPK